MYLNYRKSSYPFKTAIALLCSITSVCTVSTLGWLYASQPSPESSQEETQATIHATSIPWLNNQEACQATGRTWQGQQCWDAAHSSEF